MPGDSGFRWVYAARHIDQVFQKIQETGKPDKLTTTHLAKSWLLKDAQIGAVLDVLKDMGFLDDTGIPTSEYSAFQNKGKSKKVLAKGIKKAYSKIFRDYPNANTLDSKQLEGYITEHTGAEKAVVSKIRTTFTKLCSLADFTNVEINPDIVTTPQPPTSSTIPTGSRLNMNQNLQLNFEIHISADTPVDKIEAIFISMKKHLFTNK